MTYDIRNFYIMAALIYTSRTKGCISVCRTIHREPFPVIEDTLMLIIASLFCRRLASTTIKTYLAALKYEQISLGLGDPMISQMLRLKYVIRGIKRCSTPGNCRCLSITPRILLLMKQFWAADPGNANHKILWVASCLYFFGFLRSEEVVAPSESHLI